MPSQTAELEKPEGTTWYTTKDNTFYLENLKCIMPKFSKTNNNKTKQNPKNWKPPRTTEVEFPAKRFQSSNQVDINKANEVPFYLKF